MRKHNPSADICLYRLVSVKFALRNLYWRRQWREILLFAMREASFTLLVLIFLRREASISALEQSKWSLRFLVEKGWV